MKKLLSGLFAFAMMFSLAGCNKDDDDEDKETKVVTFAEYLAGENELTASKLNTMVGPVTQPTINGVLSDLDVKNTSITIDTEEGESIVYMWGKTETEDLEEQKYIYFGIPKEEPIVEKVNLTYIESFVEQLVEEIEDSAEMDVNAFLQDRDNSGTIEFTEVVDTFLEGYGVDLDKINTASVLSEIDFDINDFVDKGNGVYQLKSDAIMDVIESIVEDFSLDDEDVLETFEDLVDLLTVKVKYANNHIENVLLKIIEDVESDPEYTTTIKISLNLGFTYDGDEVSKTEIDFVDEVEVEYTDDDDSDINSGMLTEENSYYAVHIVLADNEFSMSTKVGESKTKISHDIEFSKKETSGKTNIDFSMKVEGTKVISLGLEIIGNWLSSFDAEFEGMTLEVDSNVNVVVPNELKYTEAYDATDMVMDMILTYIDGLSE